VHLVGFNYKNEDELFGSWYSPDSEHKRYYSSFSGIKGAEYMEWTGTVRTRISKTVREKDSQGFLIASALEGVLSIIILLLLLDAEDEGTAIFFSFHSFI